MVAPPVGYFRRYRLEVVVRGQLLQQGLEGGLVCQVQAGKELRVVLVRKHRQPWNECPSLGRRDVPRKCSGFSRS